MSINLMLVGLGLHARRVHVPAIHLLSAEGARLAVVVDLATQAGPIRDYLAERAETPHVCLWDRVNAADAALSREQEAHLDELVAAHAIAGVVVSTEPLAHGSYLRWALRRGLSVLVDKPVVARPGLSADPTQARALMSEFDELLELCRSAAHRDASPFVSVVTHRRLNPVYQRARAELAAVFAASDMPVTSVTVEMTDGEWRTPREVLTQTYHPFNSGYGMLLHSGYHAIDAAVWLAAAGQGGIFTPDGIEATAASVFPDDYAFQTSASLVRLYGQAGSEQLVDPSALASGFGEIDAHAIVRMTASSRLVTTLNIHATHCSYSNRGWATSAGRNLYVGNGRVGHQFLSVQQGGLQTLKIMSFQSVPATDEHLHALGGDRHCELLIFRNASLFRRQPPLERISLGDLEHLGDDALAIGPGKDELVREFVLALRDRRPRDELASELESHRTGHAVLAAIYESQATGASAKARLLPTELRAAPLAVSQS